MDATFFTYESSILEFRIDCWQLLVSWASNDKLRCWLHLTSLRQSNPIMRSSAPRRLVCAV